MVISSLRGMNLRKFKHPKQGEPKGNCKYCDKTILYGEWEIGSYHDDDEKYIYHIKCDRGFRKST